MEDERIIVRIAQSSDCIYAQQISEETERSAIARGSGISKRSIASILDKMNNGRAVVALSPDGKWAGFSYFDVWDNGKFVSNSGLIVSPDFRQHGVAHQIKEMVFNLCREAYPKAQVFSITSGIAIMKMNTHLGFEPVTYAEIAQEDAFWQGCKSCVNYNILNSKQGRNCLCTAMLYTPSEN
ncbi:N-acetyltransferase [Mucilaginibacter achroorhodeus]|uniref:N-acetyltransferase n=1 Tax=Mucilaginibacter achroorhodeus TaxID=2599294 RepID=A0A563TWT7_9SPHI|nr:N-acetyltransferase [Mucilaginibacter achroorhodeus]TWR23756.1 N-acetyltransferase [Mucilaginibacter achroorhodeus]